jgi:hypothetical protein
MGHSNTPAIQQSSNQTIKQSNNQKSKKVFLSQRNKEERSSPQSRQVVALHAKFGKILARSAKIVASP